MHNMVLKRDAAQIRAPLSFTLGAKKMKANQEDRTNTKNKA